MWFYKMRLSRTFTPDEIAEAIEQAEEHTPIAKADDVAAMLGLEYADRQRLHICTIGAVDMTKRRRAIERKVRKQEKDRINAAIKRRKDGAISREEYLAESLARARPWERLGISRRTYYRKLGTSSSPPPLKSLPHDGPVPKRDSNVRAVPQALAGAVIKLGAALADGIGGIDQLGPMGGKNRAA